MIKRIIAFIVLVAFVVSCQEQEKPQDIEIVVKESNTIVIDTIGVVINTIKRKQSTVDLTLPTPDSLFYENVYHGLNPDFDILDKYIKTYFKLTKAKAGSREAIDNPEYPEGGFCEFRTEYDRVVILEEYGCDSYDFIQTYEFSNYSLKEVTRIIKTLLPKVATENADDGWHPEGFYTEDMCSLSIFKKDNKVILEYGCGC